ncbi:MAG TPA: HD domain-containing protein [Deltaproteobacteria bacterium]|nr:HD domain-containing protein [Deltaproteobacteria bacterium]
MLARGQDRPSPLLDRCRRVESRLQPGARRGTEAFGKALHHELRALRRSRPRNRRRPPSRCPRLVEIRGLADGGRGSGMLSQARGRPSMQRFHPLPERVAALSAAAPQLVEATRLAWEWHGNQTRKGKPVSYVAHLLRVEGLVIEAGGGPDEAIAALLHDSLEDAPDPAARAERETRIEACFGAAVLRIVLDCTDTTPTQTGSSKGPWRERKERYLEQLRRAGPPSRLVAACDKRHNLGELVGDLRAEGLQTLDRFNAGGTEQLWYFEALADVFRPAIPERLARELDELVEALRALLDA